jgi:hypothetical protein
MASRLSQFIEEKIHQKFFNSPCSIKLAYTDLEDKEVLVNLYVAAIGKQLVLLGM